MFTDNGYLQTREPKDRQPLYFNDISPTLSDMNMVLWHSVIVALLNLYPLLSSTPRSTLDARDEMQGTGWVRCGPNRCIWHQRGLVMAMPSTHDQKQRIRRAVKAMDAR